MKLSGVEILIRSFWTALQCYKIAFNLYFEALPSRGFFVRAIIQKYKSVTRYKDVYPESPLNYFFKD